VSSDYPEIAYQPLTLYPSPLMKGKEFVKGAKPLLIPLINDFFPDLNLVEAGDEELGYLLGNLFLMSLPEVVSPEYNLALLGFRDILNILLELGQWYDKITIAANEKFRFGVSL